MIYSNLFIDKKKLSNETSSESEKSKTLNILSIPSTNHSEDLGLPLPVILDKDSVSPKR